MRQMPETCAVTGKPNPHVIELLQAKLDDMYQKLSPIRYAEIGVYEGDTAVAVAKMLPDDSDMHLFDFKYRIDQVVERLEQDADLKDKSLQVRVSSNSELLYDSYNWSLGKALAEGVEYDFVFIDGAHTWHHDALAFLLTDRMLAEGGIVVFDDYMWSLQTSPTMNPQVFPEILQQYTGEQLITHQVKMVVDLLVKPDDRYEELIPNVAYQKVTKSGN